MRVWSLETKQCVAILSGDENNQYGFKSVSFSNRGNLIISGSFNGMVGVWQTSL